MWGTLEEVQGALGGFLGGSWVLLGCFWSVLGRFSGSFWAIVGIGGEGYEGGVGVHARARRRHADGSDFRPLTQKS